MAIITKSLGGNPVDDESVVVTLNRETIPLLKEVRSELNRISGNPVEITAATYLVTAADRVLVFTTGAQTTELLPALVAKQNWLTFKVLGGTSLVISAQPGELIDSGPSVALIADGDSITLYSDGTKYLSTAGLGAVSSVTTNQEALTAETITGADVTLADTLNSPPVSNASVRLYVNGVFQSQGAGFDYTVSGQAITWLADTGTAVNMIPADVVRVVYEA